MTLILARETFVLIRYAWGKKVFFILVCSYSLFSGVPYFKRITVAEINDLIRIHMYYSTS